MIDESYELNFAVIQIEVVSMQLQFQHSVHHKNGQDGIAAIPQKIRVGRVGSVVIEWVKQNVHVGEDVYKIFVYRLRYNIVGDLSELWLGDRFFHHGHWNKLIYTIPNQ